VYFVVLTKSIIKLFSTNMYFESTVLCQLFLTLKIQACGVVLLMQSPCLPHLQFDCLQICFSDVKDSILILEHLFNLFIHTKLIYATATHHINFSVAQKRASMRSKSLNALEKKDTVRWSKLHFLVGQHRQTKNAIRDAVRIFSAH